MDFTYDGLRSGKKSRNPVFTYSFFPFLCISDKQQMQYFVLTLIKIILSYRRNYFLVFAGLGGRFSGFLDLAPPKKFMKS